MAIEYDVHIKTHLSPSQVIGIVATAMNVNQLTADELDSPSVLVCAYVPVELRRSTTEEDFHFTPTVSLGFRLAKDLESQEDGPLWVVRACNAILMKTQDDLVLLYNGEVPILLRTGGRLTLNGTESFWTPERLAHITGPYVMSEIQI
ncbi:SitI3 family protein [Sorangium sp. So ce1128]